MTPAKARVIYGSHFEVGEDGSVVGYLTNRQVIKNVLFWLTVKVSRCRSNPRLNALCGRSGS